MEFYSTMLCLRVGRLIRLRALRTVSEIPDDLIQEVVACDLSETSFAIFKQNLELNQLTQNTKIKYVLSDTNKHMASIDSSSKYHVIDLDPYGSAVPFLYEGIKAVKNGGLLCVTCTDTRVLCGDDRHKCYYLYGSAHGGDASMEETGIRILLYTISRIASIQSKAIKVLLSVQSDFYIRVFVQVIDSKRDCWKTIEKHGLEFHCKKCGVTFPHYFGHMNSKQRFSVNEFSLENSRCPKCQSKFLVSKLTRRSFMVGSFI